MITQKEFKVKHSNLEFRVGKISAIDMLALQTQVNFENMKHTADVFEFILEHVEVKLAGNWTAVKEKGRDIYFPESLTNDLLVLQEINMYFLANILKPLFTKSEELSQKQQ